ncbi:MAG: XRE family transcriptional regulator [Burkholderiaceae bacterium]|nr:XRE family transcriptional regulator [Burkholderiaceae bacterium]
MKVEKSNANAQQLVARINSDSRSDSQIARLAGVSQPTVSRLRNSPGVRSRSSGAFSKLCSFYGISVGIAKDSFGYNEQLRSAIVDAWDGTESHGRALLVVIKGLKGLHDPAHRNAGE